MLCIVRERERERERESERENRYDSWLTRDYMYLGNLAAIQTWLFDSGLVPVFCQKIAIAHGLDPVCQGFYARVDDIGPR